MTIDVAGIHHVALPVRDLAESVEFYGHVLGLSPAPRPENIPGASFWIGRQELHIGESDTIPKTPGHFAISIESDEYDEFLKGFSERGGTILRGPKLTQSGFYQAFTEDPSGNLIELNCAQLGSQ